MARLLAEKDQTGTWTDYIYANGKKIARAVPSDTWLRVQADGGGGGYWQWYDTGLYHNYTIQTGDQLTWRQYQSPTARGGILVETTNGGDTAWNNVDQNGNPSNSDSTTGQWETRVVNLSNLAGNQITLLAVGLDSGTTGSSTIDYADIALLSSDGTVQPIYNGQVISLTAWGGNNSMANAQTSFVNGIEPGDNLVAATHYFLTDHLGTTQMEFSAGGWPVWKGEFAPFGQEVDTQYTPNNYKFTGKERDAESGLDYFGARYYASNMGRFMSPDWAAQAEPVPYASLAAPQSLNLYSYVGNNPLNRVDMDGHVDYGSGAPTFYTMEDEDLNAAMERQNAGVLSAGLGAFVGAISDWNTSVAQQQSTSSGGGFWHHVGNLLHGHSWNYVQTTVTVTEIDTVREPNEAVTATTDAAGLIGMAAPTVAKECPFGTS